MTKRIERDHPKSQIEVDDNIRRLVSGVTVDSPGDLVQVRNLLFSQLEVRPYNDSTMGHEREIRWKRTASQILDDGYVYEGKACSDINAVFLAMCQALGLETRFVKLSAVNRQDTHTISEVKVNSLWFTYDVMRDKTVPEPGEVTDGVEYGRSPWGPYLLWKKGRDLWDLGLVGLDSEQVIYNS